MLSVLPSNINLGIRHILLVYPLLAIVAGYGVTLLLPFQRTRFGKLIPCVILLIWYLISTSLSHPDYIAYFNELTITSPERFRVDSDLDWGQDLNRLSIEAKRREIRNLSLAYFGSADPNKFNLPTFKILKRHQTTEGWVAISVSILKDVRGPPPHDGYAWLEKYKPVAIIGKSMLTLNSNLSIPAHVLFTEVDGTAVLLNTQTNQYFSLDEVGARFWELLKDKILLPEIYETLLSEYEVTPTKLEQDILELVKRLNENGLVEITEA